MNEQLDRNTCCDVNNVDTSNQTRHAYAVTLFKALGDSTRYEIFRLIAAQADEICVCNITDKFDVSQPTISHHLRILREAGLISVSRRGVWAYYEVDRSRLQELNAIVGTFAAPVLAESR